MVSAIPAVRVLADSCWGDDHHGLCIIFRCGSWFMWLCLCVTTAKVWCLLCLEIPEYAKGIFSEKGVLPTLCLCT